jgi:hypothetical protein
VLEGNPGVYEDAPVSWIALASRSSLARPAGAAGARQDATLSARDARSAFLRAVLGSESVARFGP